MSIGAGGILGAGLMLGLALGTATAWAQAPANGSWTDPPARNAAPQPVVVPPTPVAPTKEPAPAASNGRAGQAAESRVPAAKPERPARSAVRQAAAPRRLREAKRRPTSDRAADRAARTHFAAPRIVERRVAVRPAPRRVIAHAFAPPYPYAPLPVGRVEGPVDGERRPIFAEGSERMRRIAAAQAAGYLVVRARTVQFPDGRTIRAYRSYDEDDGLD